MKNKMCCILVTLIAFCALYIRFSNEIIEYNNYFEISNEVRYVDSDILEEDYEDIIKAKEAAIEEEKKKEEAKKKEEIKKQEVKKQQAIEKVQEKPKQEEKKEEVKEEKPVVSTTQNEVITGKMSGYGPDCAGCSGYVAYGKYVGNGNIYYNDKEYGKVRIVAGDKKYKFGTIVKINDSMLAIVLDRGGSIGIGKKFLFDLLYESEKEAYRYGVSYNTKFEILRNGF